MPTPDKNKAALEGLIAKANAATGGDAATVTDAVDTLIAGFGQGGGVNPLDYMTNFRQAFEGVDFGGVDLVLEFGAKTAAMRGFDSTFYNAAGLKSVAIIYRGAQGVAVFCGDMFKHNMLEYELETIDFTHFADRCTISGINQAFNGLGGLKAILGELDTSASSYNSTFYRCAALETVRFKAGVIKYNLSFAESPNLTTETIQSIIDGLADLTGGTAQTLTLHADVGAKLTDAQKAAASAKNWTLAY